MAPNAAPDLLKSTGRLVVEYCNTGVLLQRPCYGAVEKVVQRS
jgi:hypothetical protein